MVSLVFPLYYIYIYMHIYYRIHLSNLRVISLNNEVLDLLNEYNLQTIKLLLCFKAQQFQNQFLFLYKTLHILVT